MKFTRLFATAAMACAAAACSVNGPPPARAIATTAVEPQAEKPAPAAAAAVAPAAPAGGPRLATAEISGITFEGVSFDSRRHRLLVVDQPAGPGSRYGGAAEAARATGGLAAVNGGFFTPEGAPLGWLVSRGRPAGGWNSFSSLGSGLWFETAAGTSAIARRESSGRPAAAGFRELLQAGPLLVWNSRPVGGLESTKSSARTMILWDGGTRWWIGRSSPCPLAGAARALSQQWPAGWPVSHALNLDGGRSADLWVAGQVPGGPLVRRPPWNRPVRNFLVLVPH